MERPSTRISASVIGAPDPRLLGHFYSDLLGWPITEEQEGWVIIKPPGGGNGLSFQLEDDYRAPVWPPQPGAQQMMSHLDIAVEDLVKGVAWALEAGAQLADFQPQDHVRAMPDPAGHPFCLFQGAV